MNSERVDSPFVPGTWLRRFGAITFLAAGGLFLFEGVQDAGALRRELAWTATTMALSLLGIASARVAKDPAGARVLLGLAAATIPTHFAQVGAQLWSYRVEGEETLTGVLIGAGLLVALAPPLSIGVSALVRGRGLALTALLFVFSCPLLLATREGDLIAVCAVAEIAVLLLIDLAVFRGDPRMQTFEGLSARAMLLMPAAILLLRNAFYPSTSWWLASLFVAPSLVLLALPHLTRVEESLSKVLPFVAVLGLVTGCFIVCGPERWLIVSLVGLLGTMASPGEAKTFAQLGTATFAAYAVGAALCSDASLVWLMIPVGAIHVVVAHRLRSLWLLAMSVLALVVGIVGQLIPWLPDHDRWMLVAAIGVGLLALASIVERHRSQLEREWSVLTVHFAPGRSGSGPASEEAQPVLPGEPLPAVDAIYR